MTVRLIRAPDLYDGVEYAYAAVAPPGALVFTAGACPLAEGGTTVRGGVRAQARQCVANLVTALAASAPASTTCSRRRSTSRRPSARTRSPPGRIRTAFGDHDSPSTLLGVTVLGYAGRRVELEAVALA